MKNIDVKSNKEIFTNLDEVWKDDAIVFGADASFVVWLKQRDDLEAKNYDGSNNVTKWLSHVTPVEDAGRNEDGGLAPSNSHPPNEMPPQLSPQQKAKPDPAELFNWRAKAICSGVFSSCSWAVVSVAWGVGRGSIASRDNWARRAKVICPRISSSRHFNEPWRVRRNRSEA